MISFQCPCGAKYSAKDSSAGKRTKCRKCGGEIIVPAGQLESHAEETAEEASSKKRSPQVKTIAAEAVDAFGDNLGDEFGEDFGEEATPPLPKLPKRKKKGPASKPGRPSNKKPGQQAKTKVKKAAAYPRRSWGELLTGDIRPLLLGVTGVLLGIGFTLLPFFVSLGPEDFETNPGTVVRRNEWLGREVFIAAHKMFGQAGVMGLCLLLGVFCIGAGIWTIKYMEFEDDD